MAHHRRGRAGQPKKVLQQSITGQQGINLIERLVLQMGYLWYPTGGLEVGIDGHIEIRDTHSGEVTNATLRVQSKATKDPLGTKDAETFDFLCDQRDLDYWMKGTAPVILVRSRPDTDEAYWVSIKDYFADPNTRKARKVTFVKTQDKLDLAAKDRIRELALPPQQGVYFAPAPKRERLISNLLPVSSLSPKLYLAETDYRTSKDLWRAAMSSGAQLTGEWVLREKRILSFHDLAEEPWSKYCDRGTVEDFDTSEWSASEDRQKQNDFAQLLGRCLTERLRRLPIRRDKDHECYYFVRTKNLTPRVFYYQSLKKRARKTVFQGYPSKKDPTVIAYYRHTAFEAHFRRYDDQWHLEIVPTYYFTGDGTTAHPFYESKLKGIKAQERNNAVRSHVLMWADLLADDDVNLFQDSTYDFVKFGRLLTFNLDAGLYDERWLPLEIDKAADNEDAGPGLFDED